MRRNIFSNLFSKKKKQRQDDEDEDIQPPQRRCSISKTGRMKETKINRQTVTDSIFPADDNKNSNIKTNDLPAENTSIKRHAKKPSFPDELNIDDILKEMQQTADILKEVPQTADILKEMQRTADNADILKEMQQTAL